MGLLVPRLGGGWRGVGWRGAVTKRCGQQVPPLLSSSLAFGPAQPAFLTALLHSSFCYFPSPSSLPCLSLLFLKTHLEISLSPKSHCTY